MPEVIGKHVAGKQYVHVSVLTLLALRDQELAAAAIKSAGLRTDQDFNVIRVTDDRDEVALLFFTLVFLRNPSPRLRLVGAFMLPPIPCDSAITHNR